MKKFDWDKPVGESWLTWSDIIAIACLIVMAFSPTVYIHVLVCILAAGFIFIAAMNRYFLNEFHKSSNKALEGWTTSNRMWAEDIAAHKAVIENLLAERRN